MLRTREDGCVGGRAENRVCTVEFEARGTAAREAVVADDLALDAGKHPGVVRIIRGGQTAIICAFELPLARETNAGQHLRRATIAAPEAAILPIKLVVVFTGFGLPGTDTALGTAKLDDVRQFGHARHAPVETVASEIGEPASVVGVVLEGVECAGRVILGMRAGQDGPVG